MINNRQGGRRRGRGGQRGQNLGGQPGNRQDNRQRGNAAQLLEKYKSMARDAQLGGDRVQAEYYLQYADHYFRVLSESRARFEDQGQQRRPREQDFEGDDGEEQVEAESETSGDDRHEQRQGGRERFNRRDRPRREEREERDSHEEAAEEREEEHAAADRLNGGETIPFDALPPAIGRDEPEAEPSADNPAPRRRRARAARPADGDEEIAPAA